MFKIETLRADEYTIAVSKVPSDRYVNNAVKVLLEATAGL